MISSSRIYDITTLAHTVSASRDSVPRAHGLTRRFAIGVGGEAGGRGRLRELVVSGLGRAEVGMGHGQGHVDHASSAMGNLASCAAR